MTEQKENSLSEKLNNTKKRLNDLSKKVADNTKSFIQTTNNSIKTSLNERKEKREEKKQEKLNQAKKEISEDGLLDDIPKMITLPEFENERIEIAAEQNETMITIVEEMQRLSERVDSLSNKINLLSKQKTPNGNDREINDKEKIVKINQEYTINQIIHLLGVSVIWLVSLIVGDWYSTEKNLQFDGQYPFRFVIWSVGTSFWIFYILHKLSESSMLLKLPMLLKIQLTLVVGITTLIALIAYDGSTDAISNVWIWGSTIAVVLLLSASMLTYVWQSTRKLVSIKEEIEIIE